MNKRIGIIGQGFVGNSIKQGLIKDYPDLLTYDIKEELSMCDSLYELVINTDIIFICVPTPMKSTGECYTGLVEQVIKDINGIYDGGTQRILILKTTVPPGTTMGFQKKYKDYDFIFNPEFLTEANAVNDFKNQNRIILGGINESALNIVSELYRKTFPTIPIVHMTFDEAEMVKYIGNTFLSTKVIFANEIYQICQGLNIDYDRVINAARLDLRLGNSHWGVPGPDGDFGFGGHCFPKDTHALKYLANKNGVDTTLLDAVLEKNNKIRKNKDWENQKGRSVI
jgi:UDPglucose 6-dehydrogenase